ncbi:uncharacterized protein [Panulirus ornatus]|uniref:uncharacterized protein n=1 Tax=Panulirus ornatus TaxID=150431 RepID=UPI003A8718C7
MIFNWSRTYSVCKQAYQDDEEGQCGSSVGQSELRFSGRAAIPATLQHPPYPAAQTARMPRETGHHLEEPWTTMGAAEREARGSITPILRLWVTLVLLCLDLAYVRSIPVVELSGGNSSLCLKENFDALGNQFSICAHLQPQPDDDHHNDHSGTVLTLSHSGLAWRAGITSSLLVLEETDEEKGKKMTYGDPFKAGVWNHLCFYYGATDGVVLKVSGQESEVLETKQLDNNTHFDPSAPSRLCLGSSELEYPALRGLITGFYVTPLSDEPESGNHAFPKDCTSLLPSDALLTLNSSWLATGNVNTFDYTPAELCTETLSTVALRARASQSEVLIMCYALGGRLTTESEAGASTADVLSAWGRLCNASDGVVSWLSSVGDDDAHFECEDESDTDSVCGVLLANGSVASLPCIKELECSICRVPYDRRFTVYGAVKFVDHRYTLRTTPEGDMYFEGDDGYSSIERDGSDWVLQSELHSKKWRLRTAPTPTGRGIWEFQGGSALLTVTHCNAAHFSCTEGLCVPRKNLCDGLHHCADDSDEKECQLIVKHEGYVPKISPANGKKMPETMYYDPFIFAVSDITTMDGKATFDISIVFKWKDPRISIRNPKPQRQYFECSEIWFPTLFVVSGYTEGILQKIDPYSGDCFIESHKNHSPHRPLGDPYNNEVSDGSEIEINYRIGFLVTLPCHFQLQRYPFGRQMCNACIVLNNGYEDYILQPMYPEDDIYEVDNSKTDLLEFKLLRATQEVVAKDSEGKESVVVLTLHLSSLYDYHLLNSFAPSALMFFISFSSLFFPMENFNERIMVSLTALLVLATLFAQASNTSVRTPYLKLLDVWYAAMIAFCFLVVVINVIVNSLMSGKASSSSSSSSSSTVSPEFKERKILGLDGNLPAVDGMTLKVGWSSASTEGKKGKESGARLKRAAMCNVASITLLIFLSVTLILVYILLASELI